jgi:hypothetical protein
VCSPPHFSPHSQHAQKRPHPRAVLTNAHTMPPRFAGDGGDSKEDTRATLPDAQATKQNMAVAKKTRTAKEMKASLRFYRHRRACPPQLVFQSVFEPLKSGVNFVLSGACQDTTALIRRRGRDQDRV